MTHKFRIWNGKEYVTKPIYLKCSDGSIYDYEADYGGMFSSHEILSRVSAVAVEQFTGLTDINGQEIYEGDTVVVYAEDYQRTLIEDNGVTAPVYLVDKEKPLPLKDIILYKGRVVWEAPEFRIEAGRNKEGVSSIGMRGYWMEVVKD